MEPDKAFAIWVTGLPASGKSTIVKALTEQLHAQGITAAVLESDQLRRVFTPNATYDAEERDRFYSQMAWIGALLVRHGVPVIFDATANRRAYRDGARAVILRFLEVYVDAPLELCMARDPKGIYRQGQQTAGANVPGLQAGYEPPRQPDVTIDAVHETPDAAAGRIAAKLAQLHWIHTPAPRMA